MSDIGFHVEQLRMRLFQYLKIVDTKLEKSNDRDTVALLETGMEIAKNIFDLSTQGLEIVDGIKTLETKLQQQQKEKQPELSYNNESGIINDNERQ